MNIGTRAAVNGSGMVPARGNQIPLQTLGRAGTVTLRHPAAVGQMSDYVMSLIARSSSRADSSVPAIAISCANDSR